MIGLIQHTEKIDIAEWKSNILLEWVRDHGVAAKLFQLLGSQLVPDLMKTKVCEVVRKPGLSNL